MRLTEAEIKKMHSWDRCHAATVLDERARELETEYKLSFVEIGQICIAVEDRELFREFIDPETREPLYQSFGHWLRQAMPNQHSTAYAARNAIRALKPFVTESEMCEIPRGNLETLGKCSSEVARDLSVREAARLMTQNDFVIAVNSKYPDQHLEIRDPYRFAPTASQRKAIDAGISAVRIVLDDDLLTREECLEAMARYFIDDHDTQLEAVMQRVTSRQGTDANAPI